MIAEVVKEAPHSYELAGCLDADGAARTDDDALWSLGAIDDLDWISKVTRPDVIVVALEERRGTLPVREIVECKLRGIEVDDWPSFWMIRSFSRALPTKNVSFFKGIFLVCFFSGTNR